MLVCMLFLKTADDGVTFVTLIGRQGIVLVVFWSDFLRAYISDVSGTSSRCWSFHLNYVYPGTFVWDKNWVSYNEALLWRDEIRQAQRLELNLLLYGQPANPAKDSAGLLSVTVTNACSAVYDASLSSEGLIAIKVLKWGSPNLLIELTRPIMFIMLISLSSITPKSRTVLLSVIPLLLVIVMWGLSIVLLCC